MPPFALTPLQAADSARLWTLDQRCFPPGIAYSEAEIRACLLQANRGFHAAIESRQLGEATSKAGLRCRPSKPALKRPAGATQREVASHAEGAGEPPAAFILSLLHGRRGHIITLDVAPEYRRRGMGLALMQAAEQHFRAMGAAGMRLEAAVDNHTARRFYARLGYREVRPLPHYYGRGLDGLLLLKNGFSAPLSPPCHN